MDVNIITLAISVGMGIVIYSMMNFGRIGPHNITGVIIVTSLIILNYWFISSAGLFDYISPVSSGPARLPGGETITAGYVDTGGNFTSSCIEDYLYKGYDADSADKLCKVKLRNIGGS